MADEGIKAGDAYIQATLRMAPDAFAKLAAEQNANANKAGDALGDRIGAAIAKRIAAGVKDGIRDGGAGIGTQGTKQGEDFGGKFAEIVKARIGAALRSLPHVDVDLGTTEANEKVRALRTRLEELAGKRIGVDVSAADALAEIRDIKTKLDELGAKSPNVQVKADTAAAAAQLAAIQVQLARINGQTANASVSTNADKSLRDVLSLGNALAILGPAAVPSAAAAVAAILGIGAAATSVFAGIGVGRLAFSGVGDALKAMDTAQQQTAKSGATLAQQQTTLASGADQVKSAEASLANTRASAADSVRRANEQIGVSEQSLADAERAELRAQQDLTTARQDAKRSIEDLNTQVADGAIQQRQAALDVQKAKETLDATNAAGSTATQEQREQARISYDQAVQQVTDLDIRQKRAVQDRDAANKAGVEGSRQVKGAQDQLLQSQQKVGDAERGVADARAAAASAARQAAFSIAQAQQQVVSSQRALAQSFVATGATGGAALDALQVALANLSPEGQKFTRFLYGLKPQLDQLKESAQGGLLPGAQSGITTLLPYFSSLDRFVASTATELGSLERQAAQTFTSPFWRQFFAFIANQAVPNLDLLFHTALHVAEGGARIVQAFGPAERQVGEAVDRLSQKFLTFSQGIDRNQGFQSFIRYAEAEIPHVISTIEALGTTGVHLVQAYAPVGSVVVSEIRLLAQVLNAIPVPVVTALAFAFTAYKTGATLADLAQKGLNSSLVTGIGRMITYQTVTSSAGVTTTGFQRATQSAAKFIGGGGFGLALGVATLAISYFLNESQKAKQRTDDLKSSLTQFADAYRDGITPAANASAAAIVANNNGLKGLLDVTDRAGLSTVDLVKGLNGDADARRKVVQAIDDQQQSELLAADNARNGSDADNAASKAHRDRARALGELKGAFVSNTAAGAQAADIQTKLDAEHHNAVFQLQAIKVAYDKASASSGDYGAAIDAVANFEGDATTKGTAFAQLAEKIAGSSLSAADKASLFGHELDAIGESATTSGPTFDALTATFNSIARASLDAHDKVNLLSRALKEMYQPSIDLNEAHENLVRTETDLKTQIAQSSDGFDLNTKASGANKSAILQNRDALEAALTAARDKYVQDLANNVAEGDARASHDKTIQSILDGIPKRQRDTQAVKDLVTEYGAVPAKVTTDVTTPGLAEAIDQLAKSHAVQAAIGPPVQDANWIDNEYKYLLNKLSGAPPQSLFHATGGPIVGPGTATSDSVPAVGPGGIRYHLSDGEWIHQASAVDYYGHDLMAALNARAIPREMLVQHRASGGAVWPITYDMGDLDQRSAATLAELRAQYAAALRALANRSAAGSIGAAFGNLGPLVFDDSKVNPAKIASIKSFLHSVDPLPYVFGAAGPGAYDCSGIASAVVGLLTGRGGGEGQRYFTTFDFANGAPAGFKPGANGGILAVGVNPQEHMAGNFDGLPFEAKSTRKGIVVGSGVTPVGAFQKQFHLARGGPVDGDLLSKLGLDVGGDPSGLTIGGKRVPYKLFDDGGWLPPGLTLADNRTGGHERVQTQEQMAAAGGPLNFNVVLEAADPAVRDLMKLIDVRVEAGHDRVATAVGSGVRGY